MGNDSDEIEIDLKELFFVIRRRWWILALSCIVGALAAGLFSVLVLKPVYTSASMIYVISKDTALTSLADIQLGTQLTKDYKVLVTSRPVLEEVIENLNLDMTPTQLNKSITVDNESDTRILTLKVDNGDAHLAKTIVDELTKVASRQIADIMDLVPPRLVEDGNLPTVQTSPHVRKNILIGALLGIVLSGGVIVVLFVMDDTIRTEDDVEKYLGLNTLGMIPVSSQIEVKKYTDTHKRKTTHKQKK